MTKNKTLLIFTLLISVLLLSACVRPVSDGTSPTQRGTGLLEEILTATLIPVDDEEEETPGADEVVETAVQQTLEAQQTEGGQEAEEGETTPEPSATLHVITPTATAEPTEEGAEPEETEPAETQAATTTSEPQPTRDEVQINPDQEFTGAQHVETMDNTAMWLDSSGTLPDNEYIKIVMEDGKMDVTGKLNLWDTWWISGFTLNDFYIEMEVNSGECSGSDTYGMILRASQHGQPTHGYLIGFTCDGKVLAKRLETVDPYTAVSILNPTETDLINAGPNQTNIVGVAFDGNTITIYPNRYYFTTIQDSTFSFGRYGIYVQAGADGNYTYSVDEIRTWGIVE